MFFLSWHEGTEDLFWRLSVPLTVWTQDVHVFIFQIQTVIRDTSGSSQIFHSVPVCTYVSLHAGHKTLHYQPLFLYKTSDFWQQALLTYSFFFYVFGGSIDKLSYPRFCSQCCASLCLFCKELCLMCFCQSCQLYHILLLEDVMLEVFKGNMKLFK